MASVTLMILSYGRLHFIERSLRYYNSLETNIPIRIAWSGDDKDLCGVVSRYHEMDITIDVYDLKSEFHVKILQSVEKIKTKYVFIIGDDDFANTKVIPKCVEEIEAKDAVFGSGIRIAVGEKSKYTMLVSCEVFKQDDFIDRLTFSLMRFGEGKSMVSNWHIYGIHNKVNIIWALKQISAYKYSDHIERFFLNALHARGKWVRIQDIIAVHQTEQKKIKQDGNGGFSYWAGGKADDMKDLYYGLLNQINRFDREEIASIVDEYFGLLSGEIEAKEVRILKKKWSMFRSPVHRIVACYPKERQTVLRRIIIKSVVYFYLARVLLFSLLCYGNPICRKRFSMVKTFLRYAGTTSEFKNYICRFYDEKKEIRTAIELIEQWPLGIGSFLEDSEKTI